MQYEMYHGIDGLGYDKAMTSARVRFSVAVTGDSTFKEVRVAEPWGERLPSAGMRALTYCYRIYIYQLRRGVRVTPQY